LSGVKRLLRNGQRTWSSDQWEEVTPMPLLHDPAFYLLLAFGALCCVLLLVATLKPDGEAKDGDEANHEGAL
jgi:hypothetical protein